MFAKHQMIGLLHNLDGYRTARKNGILPKIDVSAVAWVTGPSTWRVAIATATGQVKAVQGEFVFPRCPISSF